jgi:hypothetical protein
MNLILAVVVAVVAVWILANLFGMWLVFLRADSTKVRELQHLQGSLRNVRVGQLANPPKANDFRVIRGLEWRDGRYVSQSRLSIEAIKSTFFAN